MSRTSTTHITTNTTVHTGKGTVISLIINHSETSAQTVTLYDSLVASGAVLASFQVSPEASPKHILFPAPYFLRFTAGLTVEPGNCTILLTSAGN